MSRRQIARGPPVGVKLLCVGDIHLGRRPARVPDALAASVRDELGPSAAWRMAVDKAIDLGVDAVLLAGDVVEQNDDFYEAYGDLRAGVERLAAAGIRTIGVSGNHDVEVLPRLADAIEDFTLLGRDGRWEETPVTGSGGGVIGIVGWSFPGPRVRTSPLADPLPPRDGSRPRVGLLHCDLDRTGSHHAPVRSRELAAADVDGWLLGHIHVPGRLDGPRPTGYLGSLVGLDPTETGRHGPWRLTLDDDGRPELAQLPLAPLRWEALAIPVDDLTDGAEVHGLLVREIEALHRRVAVEGADLRALGVRIRLTGRTAHRRAIDRELREADPRALELVRDGTLIFVNRVTVEALPSLDLAALASGRDPAALVARHLLAVRSGDAGASLVEPLRRRLAEAASAPAFAGPGFEAPDEGEIAALLEQAALDVLDVLLAQREGSG